MKGSLQGRFVQTVAVVFIWLIALQPSADCFQILQGESKSKLLWPKSSSFSKNNRCIPNHSQLVLCQSKMRATGSSNHMTSTAFSSSAVSQSSEPDRPTLSEVHRLEIQQPIEHWRSYEDFASTLIFEKRVLRKCAPEDAEAVQEFLLDPTFPCNIADILDAKDFQLEECNDIACCSDQSFKFRSRLERRRTYFLESKNFNRNQIDYMDRCFTYMGDRCASTKNSIPLQIAWLKLRLTGFVPRENSVSTYMYVLGLDESNHKSDCFWDTIILHDLLYPPNEKTITLRIQLYISQNDPQAAEELLESLLSPSDNNSKLRTFTPILSYYCEAGEMSCALRLFGQMRESKGVHLDTGTYAMLLHSLATQGYFTGKKSVPGQGNVGSELFDYLATQMADDLLELTEDAAKTLYDGFLLESAQGNELRINGTSFIPPCTSISEDQVTTGRVQINETTSICSSTGVKLRLLVLNDGQRQYVHDSLLEMAFSLQEEFREKTKAKPKVRALEPPTGDYCREMLQNFSSWLAAEQSCANNPFTVFVDGANVAYFGQGKVQYSQIKLMVEELEKIGEKPLVIMPRKYTTKKFYLRQLGIIQELAPKEEEVMNNLIDSGKCYVVPACCFDDYYYMIATVTNQNPQLSEIANVDIPQGEDGICHPRLAGLRPIVITNDQMRDHRLALMDPRPFRRWTSTHFVNYHIEGYENDPWEPDRKVILFPPKTFSREIQCNEVPSEHSRKAWHFPVTGWDEPDRLCISLPPTYSSV